MSMPVVAVVIALFWAAIAVGICFRSADPAMGTRIFEDLELYTAVEKQEPLLLVIVGHVYDVSSGFEYYGRNSQAGDDESYMGFANGTDNSRAFLTADFENNATDDLSDLLPGQCLGIEHWKGFYEKHEKYQFVGLHHGRYYDATGTATAEHAAYNACVERGREARLKARMAAQLGKKCDTSTPTGEPRFNIGTWKTYSCESASVPRRITIDGVHGVCSCMPTLLEEELAQTMKEYAMEEDIEMPQLYSGCDREAARCTVREA